MYLIQGQVVVKDSVVVDVVHFDDVNTWDWEEGELEELHAKAEKEPEKYIPSDGSVSTMEIGGGEIVYGCQCDLADQYEKFIINHAHQLAEYLNKRSEMLKQKSDEIKVG